jgi:cytidine deaminase
LSALRRHAFSENSHFAVASILELTLPNEALTYVCGVNVENFEHNRLSLHAEQNALAAAQSLFGEGFKVSKVWVMAAPDFVEQGSDHPLATHLVMPCGHCRQILLSFSSLDTEVCSVTVNGEFGKPERLLDLLPKAFGEQDIKTERNDPGSLKQEPGTKTEKLQVSHLLAQTMALSNDEIRAYFAVMEPHIIDPKFKTSNVLACLIQATDQDGKLRYFPGSLMQDIAFLTTDAIFSSLGLAMTELGGKQFIIQAIHCYGSQTFPTSLSGSELNFLALFATMNTQVIYHTETESTKPISLKHLMETQVYDKFRDKH